MPHNIALHQTAAGAIMSSRRGERGRWADRQLAEISGLMAKQVVNPPNLFPSLQHGFSQAVLSSGSRLLFVSGQTGWDATKQLVGGADLAGQVRQAFQNLATAVRAAGADLGDVMTLRIYFVEAARPDIAAIGAALKEWFPHRPAGQYLARRDVAGKAGVPGGGRGDRRPRCGAAELGGPTSGCTRRPLVTKCACAAAGEPQALD